MGFLNSLFGGAPTKYDAQKYFDYAEKQMWNFHAEAIRFIDTHVRSEVLRKSLVAYLDYVIRREK